MQFYQDIKIEWKKFLSDKNLAVLFAVSIVVLAFILYWITKFLIFVEARDGIAFRDPILRLFEPIDVTWVSFGLIYGGLIVALFYLTFHPERFMLALQAYSFMLLIRIVSMYLLPLNPPENIIPLRDPFVEIFGGKTFLKDLFFSGHTSTMFVFFLTAQRKGLKIVFLIATFLIAACVLIQHVHYSVDVLIAPFIAYASYRISLNMYDYIKNLK
ncbi:MAG: phosphatase PAP2-related protein [Ignavibacteriaceae bacterium]|jgi:membrane-associated phospholipid phosphatase|nr:phosphatase PAP2-related protein [Ignavibacteriaceae bacterium]